MKTLEVIVYSIFLYGTGLAAFAMALLFIGFMFGKLIESYFDAMYERENRPEAVWMTMPHRIKKTELIDVELEQEEDEQEGEEEEVVSELQVSV